MEANPTTSEQLLILRHVCKNLVSNPHDINSLEQLKNLIQNIPKPFINMGQPIILAAFYPILKKISEHKTRYVKVKLIIFLIVKLVDAFYFFSYSNKEKQLIVELLKTFFEKTIMKNSSVFFNMYSFLLFEIFDHIENKGMQLLY